MHRLLSRCPPLLHNPQHLFPPTRPLHHHLTFGLRSLPIIRPRLDRRRQSIRLQMGTHLITPAFIIRRCARWVRRA